MPIYEYKVVPAPVKGLKGKGTKGTQGRFALALETVMNELGAEGWEYLRTDTLPCEERTGLTGSTTVYQNMLVFRRDTGAARMRPDVRATQAVPEMAQQSWQPAPRGAAEVPPLTLPAAQSAPPALTPPAPVAQRGAPAAPAKPEAAAAAAAAAAALSAYRGTPPAGAAPRIGPARGDDDGNVAAE